MNNTKMTNVPSDLKYNASSPDELALVNGARFLGVTFLGKDNDTNIIKVDFKGTLL